MEERGERTGRVVVGGKNSGTQDRSLNFTKESPCFGTAKERKEGGVEQELKTGTFTVHRLGHKPKSGSVRRVDGLTTFLSLRGRERGR